MRSLEQHGMHYALRMIAAAIAADIWEDIQYGLPQDKDMPSRRRPPAQERGSASTNNATA